MHSSRQINSTTDHFAGPYFTTIADNNQISIHWASWGRQDCSVEGKDLDNKHERTE